MKQFGFVINCECNIVARIMYNINTSNVPSVSEWFNMFTAVQYVYSCTICLQLYNIESEDRSSRLLQNFFNCLLQSTRWHIPDDKSSWTLL